MRSSRLPSRRRLQACAASCHLRASGRARRRLSRAPSRRSLALPQSIRPLDWRWLTAILKPGVTNHRPERTRVPARRASKRLRLLPRHRPPGSHRPWLPRSDDGGTGGELDRGLAEARVACALLAPAWSIPPRAAPLSASQQCPKTPRRSATPAHADHRPRVLTFTRGAINTIGWRSSDVAFFLQDQ